MGVAKDECNLVIQAREGLGKTQVLNSNRGATSDCNLRKEKARVERKNSQEICWLRVLTKEMIMFRGRRRKGYFENEIQIL